MTLPNVIGVGIGERGGKRVIKVLVSRKLAPLELSPDMTIPKVLDGFEIDVEASGDLIPD